MSEVGSMETGKAEDKMTDTDEIAEVLQLVREYRAEHLASEKECVRHRRCDICKRADVILEFLSESGR